MPDPLGVTPSELRATARHLDDVSGRMKDVLTSLRDNLSAEGSAWGNDKIGDQFANGDGGFLAQLEWVDGSVEAKAGLLDHYSGGLRLAADSFEQQDQG